ncbi:MAG: class I SAM-dependent methyltransferase [Betaproteobacteria bacterium]
MKNEFETAYERYLAGFAESVTEEQRAAYRRYALGNRDRGRECVKTLCELLGSAVAGMRCLDVGSGYGGLLLALAEQGATAMGIEYDSQLFELSQINIEGEPHNIPIYQGNFLDRDALPGGVKFDLIIINDVFEHIHDIDYLFRRLDDIAHEGTAIYLEIPNNRSYHAILKEHHKFVFGLTLIEPGSWAEVTGPFNIYHRPLSLYGLLFKSIGYDTLTLRDKGESAAGAEQRIRLAHDAIALAIDEQPFKSPRLRDQARVNFARMRRYFEEDVARRSATDLFAEYESYVWAGVVTKRGFRPRHGYLQFIL